MSERTRLRWPTPTAPRVWWENFRGWSVLRSGPGKIYVFEGDFLHGHPVYVWSVSGHRNPNGGKRNRVYRKGNTWYYERKLGFGEDSVCRTDHVDGGDPNLPPKGVGWTNQATGNDSGASFAPLASFLIRLKPMLEWSVSQHRRFPKWAQDWILTIMLCDRRVAVEAFNHSDEDGKILPPSLPLEMWLMIMSQLVLGDMVKPSRECAKKPTRPVRAER
eukprot:m.120441 g.120441  ORF g.120441 m.120441 type:complete len:218 (+) comp21841_c0_seq2:71-724(+)